MKIKFTFLGGTGATKFYSWIKEFGYKATHNEELEVPETEVSKDGFKIAFNAGEISIVEWDNSPLSPLYQQELLDTGTAFRAYMVEAQADCTAVIPNNTAVERYLLVTEIAAPTPANAAKLGDLLYDNGLDDGELMTIEPAGHRVLFSEVVLAGSTLTTEENTLYYQLPSLVLTRISNIGSALNTTNSAEEVRDLLNTLITPNRLPATSVEVDAARNFISDANLAKLAGIAAGAQVNSNGIELVGLLAGLVGANKLPADACRDTGIGVVMTPAERAKLVLIEAQATQDQTAVEVRNLLETLIAADRLDGDNVKDGATNLFFTAAERGKLTGIATGAQVCNTANVTAAAAVMTSYITGDGNVGLVRRTGENTYVTHRVNLNSAADPIATNDDSENYSVNSLWFNTTDRRLFVCTDATTAAAVWAPLDVRHNFLAIIPPVVGDDDADGYSVGSIWVDTVLNMSYICVDSSAGAAVWNLISNLPRFNVAAVPPVVGDDVDDGYLPGSIWVDTALDMSYICVDASAGAAIWALISNLPKFNVAAVPPVVGDDDADGYLPGSIWVDTVLNMSYICVDASTGAAIWNLISNLPRFNVAAAPPAVGNDDTEGYLLGSIWLNSATGIPYMATDVTTGAAVWVSMRATDNAPTYSIVELESALVGAAAHYEWAAAFPVGVEIMSVKYINEDALTSGGGAATYKIELLGGVVADLVLAIPLTKNAKGNLTITDMVTNAPTDVRITADAGTIDAGPVHLSFRVRLAESNYPDFA